MIPRDKSIYIYEFTTATYILSSMVMSTSWVMCDAALRRSTRCVDAGRSQTRRRRRRRLWTGAGWCVPSVARCSAGDKASTTTWNCTASWPPVPSVRAFSPPSTRCDATCASSTSWIMSNVPSTPRDYMDSCPPPPHPPGWARCMFLTRSRKCLVLYIWHWVAIFSGAFL